MSVRPETLRLVRALVAKAEEDFTNARHTLTMTEGCPLSTVAFHAQQCAEKYLKALLAMNGVPFPKTHDLEELLGLAPDSVALGFIPEDLSVLAPYAVDIRYSDEERPLTRKEVEGAVALAGRVREAVRAHLPQETLKG